MRTRLTVGLMVLVLAFYVVLVGVKGIALLTSGSVIGALLGVAVLVIPLIGVYLVVRELEFGRRSARLAAILADENALTVDDLPRAPSGRVERTAADRAFESHRMRVERDPEDWRGWYLLGVAYDDAGDRTRARAAVRQAIALYDGHGSGSISP